MKMPPNTLLTLFLAAAVPLRPIIAVYHHIRRSYHPLKQQGRWAPHEDDALKQCVSIDSIPKFVLIDFQSGSRPWPTVGKSQLSRRQNGV